MRLASSTGLEPVTRDERPFGQVRLGLLVLAGAEEVAGVDGRGGQLPGAAHVRSVPRTPGVAGVGTVALGGSVPQPLEGVPAVAEVLRPLGDPLQFPGVDLGPVLSLLQVAKLGREPVDRSVEPDGLHVQGIDEAPEQALAFVGELCTVGGDLVDEGVEDRLQSRQGLGLVPDGPGIGLAAVGTAAEVFEVLADDRGGRGVLSVS